MLIYDGIEVTELCGLVCGTTSTWYRGDGVIELRVGSSTSPSRERIEFRPNDPDVRLAFPESFLSRDTQVPAEAIASRSDIRRAGDATSMTGPADEARVTVRRRSLNPELDPLERPRYRRFSWRIVCGGGLFVSDATNVVELTPADGSSPWPELADWESGGPA